MHSKSKIFLTALLSTIILASSSFSADKLKLAPEKAIELGLKNSKSLHSAHMKSVAAHYKSKETNTSLLPKITGGASYSRLSEVPAFAITPPGSNTPIVISDAILDNYNFKLSLQQPIFTGFRLKSNADLQKSNANAEGFEYIKSKNELVFDLKSAYWNLYKANEFKKVIDVNVENVEVHLKDIQNLFTQGMVTNNEVLAVQVQQSNMKLLQIDAVDNVKLAMIALNNLMGISLDTEIELTADVGNLENETAAPALLEAEALIKTALENRPDLKAMSFRVSAAKSGIGLAKSSWYPQIYLGANYYYSNPNQRFLPAKDAFEDTWDLGVSASVDLWNWGAASHQTQSAKAQFELTKDGFDQLKDGISLEVTSNILNMNEAKQKITVAKIGVERAEEGFRTTRDKFRAGLSANSDLLDAENAMLTAKWNYTQAVVDYELAQAKLLKSTGQN